MSNYKECQYCKLRDEIACFDWWAPGHIVYCFKQYNNFLLPWLDCLRDGEWPPEPTSYVGKSSNRNTLAPFVNAEEVAGEIDYRLEMLPDKGKLLLSYDWDKEYSPLLSWEAEINLKFICGWKRKRISYRRWIEIKKFYLLKTP
jgi:hypothetical protein